MHFVLNGVYVFLRVYSVFQCLNFLLKDTIITVLASTTVDLYFLHNFHLDSSEFV